MKKKYIYSSAAALLLSIISYQAGLQQATMAKEDNRVAYVGEKSEAGKKKEIITDTKNMSPDEVSAKEGINAEQIVVKITDQGYVTSHGDHYHYYNGKVPFDAIISEELIIKDSDYVFNQADVVNDVKDGYIIKKDGQYYLYLKDTKKTTNVRTKEEIARQQESSGTSRPSHETGRGSANSSGSSHSNSSRQSSGNSNNQASGNNSQSSAKPYTTDDGYVFSPTDVIDDLGDGFLVPHGDHFHFIPKNDLSPGELSAAQAFWNAKKSGQAGNSKPQAPSSHTASHSTSAGSTTSHQPVGNHAVTAPTHQQTNTGHTTHQQHAAATPTPAGNTVATNKPATAQPQTPPANQAETLSDLLQQLYAQPLSNRHVEADGLVFDPATITKRTASGVVVPHGDHFHFIPFSHMSELEAKISRIIPIGQALPAPSQPAAPVAIAKPAPTTPPATPTKPVVTETPAKPVLPETPVTPTKPVYPETPTTPVKPVLPETPKQPTIPETPAEDSNKGPVDLLGKKIEKSAKGKDGLVYTTSDGYTFTAESILEYDDQGLRAEHGDHEHYIFFHELEDFELEAAQNYINREHLTAVKPSTYSKAEIEAKLRYISLENGVPYDLLIVTGNQVIIPHGNHSHIGNLDNYPVALRLADHHDLDEYRNLLISLKMSHLRLQDGVRSAYRRNDVVVVVNNDGSEREVKLEAVKLNLDYEEVDYSGLVTAVDPNEAKLAYIAKQYGVPRDHVRVLFDNLVMVEDRGGVNLDLVDINDEVIYTLRDRGNQPAPVENKPTEHPKVETGDVVNPTTPAPETNKALTSDRASLIAHLGHHYGAAAEQVSYMPRIGYIVVPVSGEENLIISEELAKASLSDPSLLPALTAKEEEEETPVVDNKPETKPETTPTTPAKPVEDQEAPAPTPVTDKETPKEEDKTNPLTPDKEKDSSNLTEDKPADETPVTPEASTDSETAENPAPSEEPSTEEAAAEEEGELDDYDRAMRARAKEFGMDAEAFEDALINIALEHNVGLDSFQYHPENRTVSFIDANGKRQVVRVPGH